MALTLILYSNGTEAAEFNNREVCPNTFVHIVQFVSPIIL